MRKLHLFTHSYPTEIHPFDATFVRDHAAFLNDLFDINIHLIQPLQILFSKKWRTHRSEPLSVYDIPVQRISYVSYPARRWPSKIRKNLWKSVNRHLPANIDGILHLHFLYPSGLIIPFLKSTYKLPVCITIHGEDWYQLTRKSELLKLAHESLQAADLIITVGPLLKESISDFFPELKDKIQVVPNAIDTSFFKPISTAEKQKVRKKLDLDHNRIHLLSVANLRKKKGIDILLKAWQAATFEKNATLHLIGRPDEEEMLSLVKNIDNTYNKTVIYHGPLPREIIKEYYQASDLFVLASRNEPFGISLIEAISCGLPCISTKSGGPEMIMNERTGIMCEANDVRGLQMALENMTQDLSKYKASSMYQYIQDQFSATAYNQSYTQLYNKL